MQKPEKSSNLSINIFEVHSDQVENGRKHKLNPIQISKNDSKKFVDLLIYKHHYVLNKKLHVFSGKHDCIFNYRRLLSYFQVKMF